VWHNYLFSTLLYMSKNICLLIIAIAIATKGLAQLDSVALAKIADKIELNFELFKEEEFGPVRLSIANTKVLIPHNDDVTAQIRTLLFTGEFKDTKSLFAWLLPIVDKIALKRYFEINDDLYTKYASLYSNMVTATCPCFNDFEKVGVQNISRDSNSINGLRHIWDDTSFLSAYRKKILSLDNNSKIRFLQGLVRYAQVNCDNYFKILTKSSLNELPERFDKGWENFKISKFFDMVHYDVSAQTDSLLQIFPSFKQYLPELQKIASIYQKNPLLQLPTTRLVQQPGFDRNTSFFVIYSNGKPTILGQAVYEVGTDKFMPYIKKLTFYARENLQNIKNLEKSMPPLPFADSRD